jgi:hypothetical protein
MQIRINQRSACLVLVLASATVSAADEGVGGADQAGHDVATPHSLRSAGLLLAAADTLPKSRDALFADDEPATESPPAESRESLFGNDEPGQPQAAEPPTSRDLLFGDDQPQKPGTASAGSSSLGAAGFKGFVQNVMAYTYAKPAHWSEMMTRVDLSAQGDLGSNIKWKLGARVDYDATYTLTDFYPQAVADDQRFNVLLRENYLDIGAGDWDFRFGRQQIVWGEMVGLLFGDVVSAKDMRQFILPEFEILRIPQWAARAEYFKDDFHLELLWIPVASYDNIGKPGSEFYAYTLPPPPGFSEVIENEKFPSRSLSNTNYGLRLSVLRDGWDVAAFAYSSMSVAPTFYREIRAGFTADGDLSGQA